MVVIKACKYKVQSPTKAKKVTASQSKVILTFD